MKPIRVLHVLGSMNRGGVETWLMHVVRHIDHEKFQMDFLVHTTQPAAYDAELRSLGARILPCPATHRPMEYGKRFLEIVKQFGPFDVLHSHVHNFSGYVVWLGSVAGIPMRISHSHNDTGSLAAAATRARRVYLSLSRRLLTRYSTSGFAASGPAASALFGSSWKQDRRIKILYYGIDMAPYSVIAERAAARSEFHFRASNFVFGHVGRFDPQKNHAFLIDIAAEIANRDADARFLLVGDGPLRPVIEDRARRAGIASRTVFAGSRADVPRLMMGGMDGFLFPSHYEGLGLALIEAQAACLPATISDAIPAEADVAPDLITRLSLRQPAALWAEHALRHRKTGASDALARVTRSQFNITASVQALMQAYGNARPG